VHLRHFTAGERKSLARRLFSCLIIGHHTARQVDLFRIFFFSFPFGRQVKKGLPPKEEEKKAINDLKTFLEFCVSNFNKKKRYLIIRK